LPHHAHPTAPDHAVEAIAPELTRTVTGRDDMSDRGATTLTVIEVRSNRIARGAIERVLEQCRELSLVRARRVVDGSHTLR
jgi:hypothetical protein